MWRGVGASVPGHGRPAGANQDALRIRAADDGRVEVALADGHGGAAYSRSRHGAELAVRAALAEPLVAVDDAGATALTERVIRRWRGFVQEDLVNAPARGGERLYGTTLIAVGVGEVVVCIQIGDGHILFVDDGGRVSSPLPDDPRLVGNITTSLAGRDPLADARLAIFPATGIDLVMACTDGYENSFADVESFHKAALDLADMATAYGVSSIEAALPGWLAETSTQGSGDDTSVALIIRTPASGT